MPVRLCAANARCHGANAPTNRSKELKRPSQTWARRTVGLVGVGCQADEGIAHEHSPGAVRDAGRMAIAGDFQSLAGEIVRVEPGIDDETPPIPQTLNDL